ncbi:MAG: hypothetical protein EA423_11435 [Phycisphaerales bacterium]|nr:MAG: hypothetical protein EA423_11435 [Phycisphaerales bacterium]
MMRGRVLIPIVVFAALLMSIGLVRIMTIAGASPRSEFLAATMSTETVPDETPQWLVEISLPDGPPRVVTDRVDSLGRAVTVSCASCHSNFDANSARRSADEPPMSFHQGLTFQHGNLSCVTCHNPDDYNALRLADGTRIEYRQVMKSCAQCHAPQARDYERGLHGGMTGFWDRTKGPQKRKSCIDCHDPHAPKFPSMTPTFKPIDRFLEPTRPGD